MKRYKEKSVILKNNSRYALQQKSLVSKFLHHSLAEPSSESRHCQQTTINGQGHKPQSDATPTHDNKYKARFLPEPRLEEEFPDPTINHKFARNVVWTFEDIQMLLGTDMPIFGGSTHPCISLRLRDMAKPISVLTGIDYWLDNLMCNVPEVVMCYHLDGIVQRYELIKTEDLPTMPDSKFSPKLIRDVAQNILSFLKSNATKAGHTYWLFKGKDEEVVKLYDLTSLCSEGLIEKGQNPFTVPVAMLLYRVARNMKHNSNSQPGTIRMLLKNCLSLLPKEKYPQIVTSAHYMLSDLYVPVNTDPTCPAMNDIDSTDHVTEDDDNDSQATDEHSVDDDYDDFDCDKEATNSVAVKSLCVSNFQHHPSGNSDRRRHYKYSDSSTAPPPLVGSIEERCNMALQHVVEGLRCLKYFESDSTTSDNNECRNDNSSTTSGRNRETETPKMAHPFQPIPMPYSPLHSKKNDSSIEKHVGTTNKINKKNKKINDGSVKNKRSNSDGNNSNDSEEVTSPRALLCKPYAEALPTWQQPEHMDNASWNMHLKTLLYEKACLVYITLAEQFYNTEKYASALHYIQLVLKCSCHMCGVYDKLVSSLLGRAGDCCFQLVQRWHQSDLELLRSDFSSNCDVDRQIADEMDRDSHHVIYTQDCQLIPENLENNEQLLLASYRCYNRALILAPSDILRRRLGNIHNELGSFYMNQAAAALQTSSDTFTKEKFDELFKTVQWHLEQGVEQFETVRDNANLALLYSNTGRLMRLMAHYYSSNEGYPLTKTEKYYYNKALSSYQSALNVIGSRKVNPLVWDTINWELSTALYTLATLSQDYPMPFISKSKGEAEREVVELLQKALKQCDLDTPGPRQPVYQFRAASLHHRLGSLYHKVFRSMSNDEPRRKNVLQLCQSNYERAARLLLALEHPSEYLRVQLERVAVLEFQAESCTSVHGKVKAFQAGLDILIQCRSMLIIMNASSSNSKSDSKRENSSKDVENKESGCEDGSDDDKASNNSNERNNRNVEEKEKEEEIVVLNIMEQRLQYILKTLTKLSITHPQSRLSELSQLYKEAYSVLLKRDEACGHNTKGVISHLITVIDKLKST
ncbi:erythroid differentiation-related factor 1-like isoform X2 [Lycorma delicatula]|uniref:erythroid differentiation-related factor 1-like isoform X2 n=1 Tax=Lycorma delicatula TaxID=130591 RepID=UPI003F513217